MAKSSRRLVHRVSADIERWRFTPWRELERQSIDHRLNKENNMELRKELEECIAQLDLVIAARKHMLDTDPYWTRQIEAGYERPSMYAVMDANGRPILADVLVAKANTLAALANMSQSLVLETK